MRDDERYMKIALEQARQAGERGEVPVGAVLVHGGEVLAAVGNTRQNAADPFGHAEMSAIAAGCRALGDWRLSGCTLYVTLEPCPMCAGAILNARLERLVYGASDAVMGCVGSRIHLFDLDMGYRPKVTAGVLAEDCGLLLTQFFRKRRSD